MTLVFVAAAGAIGGLLRWVLFRLSWRPMGTFIVNMTGALTLGLIASSVGDARTILGLAGLGAFTTVSGAVDDAATMLERGRPREARAYVTVSVVFGIAAAWFGLRLGR